MSKKHMPNKNSRRGNAAKKNVVTKVECGCCKNGANIWSVVIPIVAIAIKSLIEYVSK